MQPSPCSRESDDAWADVPGFTRGARLGEGASGVVYRAKDQATGEPVALKVVRAGVDERTPYDAWRVGRTVHQEGLIEARQITRDAAGRLVVVTALAEGPTLATWRPPSAGRAARVAVGLSRALRALHARGLTHGDLSPANIVIVGPRSAPRLLDFGAGADAGGGAPATVGFAAPERLGGAPPDPASDRYALGCLVHLLCVGRPLFADVPPDRLVVAHLAGVPDLDLPDRPALAEVLRRLLARAPIERYASTDDAADALAAALDIDDPAPASSLLDGVAGVVPCPAARQAREAGRCRRGVVLEIVGAAGAGRTACARTAAADAVLEGAAALLVAGGAGRRSFDALAQALDVGNDGTDGQRADRLLARLLQWATERPLVVLLDAAEDPARRAATLQVLSAAARLAPVVVIATRDDTAPAHPGAVPCPIEPLGPEVRRALLAARLDAPDEVRAAVDDLLADAGVERAGPLVASLRALADAGLLVRRGGSWAADRAVSRSLARPPCAPPPIRSRRASPTCRRPRGVAWPRCTSSATRPRPRTCRPSRRRPKASTR